MCGKKISCFLRGATIQTEVFGLDLRLHRAAPLDGCKTEITNFRTLIALFCGGFPSPGENTYWFPHREQCIHFRFLIGKKDPRGNFKYRFNPSPWRPVIWRPKDDRDLDDIPF